MIVKHLEKDPYFVVPVEILKGTNSKDKAQESQEFLQCQLKIRGIGLIATHDLSLCKIVTLQQDVENYYFDVQVRRLELFFAQENRVAKDSSDLAKVYFDCTYGNVTCFDSAGDQVILFNGGGGCPPASIEGQSNTQ